MFGPTWVPRPRNHQLDQHPSESTIGTTALEGTSQTSWRRMSWKSGETPPCLVPAALRKISAWIRDDLDPLVAKEGPKALLPDDILTVHTVLLALQQYQISLPTLRISRIHLAIAEICGKATRWPSKLADEADRVIDHLEDSFGSLKGVRVPLFENNGRLFGICNPGDSSREALLAAFTASGPQYVDNSRAYHHGSLNFKPGKWWINGMFAFRDGIIDDKVTEGGICYKDRCAYAIVMTDLDEREIASPENFTYRCGPNDPGRFKLTSATHYSRYRIRVLRSHTLMKPNSPQAGLRYDGLYRVTGWVVRPVKINEESQDLNPTYDVKFTRDDDMPIARVLRHPTAEELDDYKAYKIAGRVHKEIARRGVQSPDGNNSLQPSVSSAGPERRRISFSRPSHIMKIYDEEDAPASLLVETSPLSREPSPVPNPSMQQARHIRAAVAMKSRANQRTAMDGSNDGPPSPLSPPMNPLAPNTPSILMLDCPVSELDLPLFNLVNWNPYSDDSGISSRQLTRRNAVVDTQQTRIGLPDSPDADSHSATESSSN